MIRLIAAAVLILATMHVSHAETPNATQVIAVERSAPAAVCPIEMARAGFECVFGWNDARGALVCQRWERTRSLETGRDKFGKTADAK